MRLSLLVLMNLKRWLHEAMHCVEDVRYWAWDKYFLTVERSYNVGVTVNKTTAVVLYGTVRWEYVSEMTDIFITSRKK